MAISPNAPGHLASQESLLLDYLHRLERHKRGRRAVHVHLSHLLPQNRREHHIRVAANTFENLVKMLQGQLFVLANADLFFIFKAESLNDVETSILRLRFLFSDDPFLVEDDENATRFCTYYDVETEYDRILQLVRTLVHEDESAIRSKDEDDSRKSALQMKQSRGQALTPRVLGRVEQALQRADISNMVRRQYVCGLVGEAIPQPLFSELFISISDLRATLLPDVNLSSSRWLFQHLTETLDRRMLAMLARSTDRTITGDISINLNVSTLLSREFMRFDDSVIASMRGSIVVELQNIDIYADLNAFLFARDFAKDHGYRICIDGLTEESMRFIDREKLGADMVKLIWRPSLREKASSEVRDLVKRAGKSRVILCRCDDAEAIVFGQSTGIGLFQGRHVENLIAEELRRRELENVRRRVQGSEFIE